MKIFSRVILQECDNEDELIKAEEYYLNLYKVDENPDYYNLTRKSRTGYPVVRGSKLPEYWKDNMSRSAIERVNRGEYINPAKLPGVGDKISKSLKEGYATGRIRKKYREENSSSREDVREKISTSVKEAYSRDPTYKDRILETKHRLYDDNPEFHKKLSESKTGDKNPCFRTIWVNDGVSNKRVTEEEYDSVYKYKGFIVGRLCKPYGKRK